MRHENKPVSWSYSRLTAFETCPKQFYHKAVAKDVVEPISEHLTWGNTVHKTFEDYINGDLSQVPSWFEQWLPVVQRIKGRSASVGWDTRAEVEIVLNKDLERVGWWDDDAWLRSKLDVLSVRGSTALVFDWKTGKRRVSVDQMDLFAFAVFTVFPEVEDVVATYVWLKDGKIDPIGYTRSQVPEIWAGFQKRLEQFDTAFKVDHWPPKPSGLCKRWCPVPKSKCEYSGRE